MTLVSYHPTDITLFLTPGADFNYPVFWTDQAGTPLDLTGMEVIWTITIGNRKIVKFPPVVDYYTSRIELQLTDTEVDSLGTDLQHLWGSHKVVIQDPAGPHYRAIRGNVFYPGDRAEDLVAFGPTSNIQVFTVDGTWLRPPNALLTNILLIGGGGGGGSGARGVGVGVRGGGAGGGGGSLVQWIFTSSHLNPTEAITIGSGGAGGTVATTAGIVGSPGTASLFGDILYAPPGLGGQGGKIGDGSTGGTGGQGTSNGGAGGVSAAAVPGGDGVSQGGSGGGGGGGALAADNSYGDGGGGAPTWNGIQTLGAGGIADTLDPEDGNSNGLSSGGGGGGGASTNLDDAQHGANGGLYGGGGGGGGAGHSAFASGLGGDGASGLCVVITMVSE